MYSVLFLLNQQSLRNIHYICKILTSMLFNFLNKFIFLIVQISNLFVMAQNYRHTYLVMVGDDDVSVYKYETCIIKKPFVCFRTK